ncbi:hypothetical protein C8Q78DRAFT_1078023 [Trametes maxima]|nr:hypothetical protein C8Q78DRAFT_1078023 [Trametes maxima]
MQAHRSFRSSADSSNVTSQWNSAFEYEGSRASSSSLGTDFVQSRPTSDIIPRHTFASSPTATPHLVKPPLPLPPGSYHNHKGALCIPLEDPEPPILRVPVELYSEETGISLFELNWESRRYTDQALPHREAMDVIPPRYRLDALVPGPHHHFVSRAIPERVYEAVCILQKWFPRTITSAPSGKVTLAKRPMQNYTFAHLLTDVAGCQIAWCNDVMRDAVDPEEEGLRMHLLRRFIHIVAIRGTYDADNSMMWSPELELRIPPEWQ